MKKIKYTASPTMRKFHASSAFVRGVMGPLGSGKSVGMCCEIMRRANEQKQAEDGIRYTRWAVIRNTYRELIDTTVKTFLAWFGDISMFNQQDMSITIETVDLHCEILFRSLDKPRDVKKLLSLELTGAFINEAREIPKAILDALTGRVGRYPSTKDGGCTWSGIMMDTNPPDSDHWWYKLFEEDNPEGFVLFKQPSGFANDAENIKNLPVDYYKRMAAGKSKDWISVYIENRYGYVQEGKPVYPEFSNIHITDDDIVVPQNTTIYVGVDFGLTPAAILGYRTVTGRWFVFDELVSDSMGAKRFSQLLKHLINSKYPNRKIEIYGDPAGTQRAQTDETTPFQIFHAEGLMIMPAPSNDFNLRRESVANMLNLLIDGKPAVTVGTNCKMFRKGMLGAYCYKRVQIAGDDRFHDKPDKNMYSHVAEAGQYMFLGAGESKTLFGYADDDNYSQPEVSDVCW